MKGIILLGILGGLCVTELHGSTIVRGKVVDTAGGESLVGAVVHIRNTTLYTITDLNGFYSLAITGMETCNIHCSYLGFASVDTVIVLHRDTTEINFFMVPDIIDLNSVVVTGNRAERKLKDVSLITQVVTTHEIEKVGAVNLQEALEMAVPGLEFQQEGYGTNLKMQGLDGKYVLILIDGERMAGETRGNIDYSRLNAANVERIEVVRGASSSLYGSKAIGGVINIITKKHHRNGAHISLNTRSYPPDRLN
jgi:outer membrane receptor for ferrienterochelin and colicins